MSSHVPALLRRHGRMGLVCGAALLVLAGCQFFTRTFTEDIARSSKKTGLPPLKAAQDALTLDMVIIDRRADDPLLGSQLWNQVDQVGALSPETRELLRENGCQVGHVSASPPVALLKLLGANSEIEGVDLHAQALPKSNISGRTYTIPSGMESEVQTSDPMPECHVQLVDADRTRSLQLEQARGVFRVKPLRMQDGWVRVEFIPELHHGDMKLRPQPTEDLNWALKSTQSVVQCYQQRFAVTLNVGETAIVGAAPGSSESLGDRFFRHENNGELRQRILVVRLVDMGRPARIMD